jgi:hypothetical protein
MIGNIERKKLIGHFTMHVAVFDSCSIAQKELTVTIF